MYILMERRRLFIFDFDGVLSVPWSKPEVPYEQVPDSIRKLSENHILGMASFNPRANKALGVWKLDQYFSCARSGANCHWNGFYRQKYRVGLTKSDQIINMIENEISKSDYIDIVFFDDDPENLKCVNKRLPHVKTVLVDNKIGFRLDNIPL